MKREHADVAERLLKLSLLATKAQTISAIYKRVRPGKDGRIRTVLSPVGTETGRFSSSDTFLEASCVTGDAEILTPLGWTRFDTLQGDNVTCMQWDAGELSFVKAPITRAPYVGQVIVADSWFHRMRYTPNHRILYEHPSHAGLHECSAEELAARTSAWTQPVSGCFADGSAAVPPMQARMLAAIQADFSISKEGAVYGSLKRNRKKQRFEWLCARLGWRVTITMPPSNRPGYVNYYIPAHYVRDLLRWLEPGKRFNNRMLEWSAAAIDALVDEVAYWDAHRRVRSYEYFTIVKDNAEWLATLAHLCGRSASIRVCENRNEGSYGEYSAQPLYTVNVKPRDYIQGQPEHLSKEEYNGMVYCVTTPSSYFLIRCGERIIVTGNTNLQNIPKKMAALDPLFDVRSCMAPRAGHVFVEADLSQAEARATAAYASDHATLALFASGQDIHKITAGAIFGVAPADVTKSQRHLGKMARHALNYGMGWALFEERINKDADLTGIAITASQAKKIVSAYHAMNEPLIAWWEQVWQTVQRDGYLVTQPFGRRRDFLSPYVRKTDCIAYLPQSTIADLLNWRMCVAYEEDDLIGETLLLQIHDAVLCEVPADRAMEAAATLQRLLTHPIIINDIELCVPVDIAIGSDSWAQMEHI